MKISFLIVGMFLTASSFAKTESAIEILNSLNEGRPSSGEQCFEGNDVSELEECAVALCGPAETAALASVNDSNFDIYVQEGVKEKLPLLEEPAKKIFEKKKARLEKFIADFKAHQSSSKPIIDFSTWKEEYNNFTYHAYDSAFELETDTSKPYSERLSIKLNPPKGTSEIYLKGLKIYAEAKKKERESNISQGLYNEFYTAEEAQKLIRDFWKKFSESYEKELAKNPDFMKNSISEIQKYQNEEAFELTDAWELGNAYNDINNLNNTLLHLTGRPTAPVQYGVDCEVECKEGIKDFITNLDYASMLKDLEKKKDEVTPEDNLLGCQAELIELGLKESDKEQFLAHVPETKRLFLERVTANYSSHSRKAFETYLADELNLSFDKFSNEGVDEFIAKLNSGVESEVSNVDNNPTALVSHFLQQRDWGDSSKMRAEIKACDHFGTQAFAAWDAYAEKGGSFDESDADPTKDNIFVSLFSCSHGSQGKGVFAHEMGHALSHAFKNGKLSVESKIEFLKVRTCVTNSHVDQKETTYGVHPEDRLYSEEDMADVVSFKAIDPESPIFTCALLRTNSQGTKFTELSLPNIHTIDNHSSPLLRVLREAVYKKRKLPSACKQILEKNKDKYRFEPCL